MSTPSLRGLQLAAYGAPALAPGTVWLPTITPLQRLRTVSVILVCAFGPRSACTSQVVSYFFLPPFTKRMTFQEYSIADSVERFPSAWWLVEPVRDVLATTASAVSSVRSALDDSDSEEVVKGALQYARYKYATEALVGEGLGHTTAEEMQYVETMDPALMSKSQICSYNILMGLNFCLDGDHPLTVANIQKLHVIVGQDVVPNAGEFRKTYAAPCDSAWTYKVPIAIQRCLDALVEEMAALPPAATDEEMIKQATYFFSQLLMIHPFRDGNGRLARLCLSWLLKKHFVVPVSLRSSTPAGRELYVACLEMVERWRGTPCHLARLVLESARKTALSVAYSADVLV